jgi:hypothetical protein
VAREDGSNNFLAKWNPGRFYNLLSGIWERGKLKMACSILSKHRKTSESTTSQSLNWSRHKAKTSAPISSMKNNMANQY